MKKLFYLLFISSVLASCTKQDPVEVTCDCSGASNGTGTNSSSFNCDSSLVGLWEGPRSGGSNYDFYINESGNGYFGYSGLSNYNQGYYSCTDGLLSFVEVNVETPACLSGNYTITGNTMTYEIIAGIWEGSTFTLTKQ